MTLLRAALFLGLGVLSPLVEEVDPKVGLDTIDEDDVEAHLRFLASPTLEGRDSPSRGLMLAAEHVAEVFEAAGLVPAEDSAEAWGSATGDLPGLEGEEEAPAWSVPEGHEGTYLRPFEIGRLPSVRGEIRRPVPSQCRLDVSVGSKDPQGFTYGEDFVPLPGQPGSARGELVWAGFGISSRKQRYDSLARLDVRGKVVMVLSGDPRGRKNFGDEEETAEASVWNKLSALDKAGAAGVIVVRRAPLKPDWMKREPEQAPLGYRYTWASWNPPSSDRNRRAFVPAIEVSEACASDLLGKDVSALAKALDRASAPRKVAVKGRSVAFDVALEDGPLTMPNVVGVLEGRDPQLREEYVIVGAHMDHVGVGVRGRTGFGADDNASGTSALLEVVDAFAAARPRRSLLFVAFSGEEDGLLGSKDLAQKLPVDRSAVVAMVNLDMIGRGKATEVYCIGFEQNPLMEKVVRRAQALGRTGVRRIQRCDDKGLFRRSDHYSFHAVGLPTVFFFENYPLEQNRDYHTWRDTFDGIDLAKVTNTARLAFCTAWLLAEDDDRLPPPGG